MAYEHITDTVPGLVAGADLSAKQFYLVKMDTVAQQVVLGAAATDELIGILQNKPASGAAAEVANRSGDITKAAAGGAIAIGDKISSDAAGKCVAVTGADDWIVGKALTACASGEIFSLLINVTKL